MQSRRVLQGVAPVRQLIVHAPRGDELALPSREIGVADLQRRER
jgi:hypothetical protein